MLVKHEARNGTHRFYNADRSSQIRGADKVLSEFEHEASELDKKNARLEFQEVYSLSSEYPISLKVKAVWKDLLEKIKKN